MFQFFGREHVSKPFRFHFILLQQTYLMELAPPLLASVFPSLTFELKGEMWSRSPLSFFYPAAQEAPVTIEDALGELRRCIVLFESSQ